MSWFQKSLTNHVARCLMCPWYMEMYYPERLAESVDYHLKHHKDHEIETYEQH